MIIDDRRYISCGGDSLTYLKSLLKSWSIDIDDDVMLYLSREKFPYKREVFEKLCLMYNLRIIKFDDDNDISILFRKI
ncbi:hypothetical protein [Picrophilus oshimae]|uniref:Uncharacterized protein n=1 Tax=Picrophilus torridus (strain ATCC 700027 / DSM 9790 / JCM 10055 / NBRC 100828 / KAW 2/3) TaxID=1122961 RepID=Q6L141_PICTO|nr:hypothetical protein [Picrophilus oshimae]AAT43311.1 hypothetical protein PTO0726 [Picrophilus oshimae DSM 9789]SMD30381.1 hypothetical protein SAMN02745355_0260 [Picrophilus oshimae DSM 9789]